MAIQKVQGLARDRDLAQHSTNPTLKHTQSLLFSNTQSHGHMAPSFRRKNLVCFYCNKRSDTKYDGLITRWDCTQCESTNFLDENGDITDPPVATESAAPGLLKYATAKAPSSSLHSLDHPLFCATCMKNQHLYTASLAQYHVETDPNHPRYKELEREYFAYRRSLEKLYPQVCEDCEPKVLERMRDAGRTAKADHLRRAMDKSRARRLNTKPKVSSSGMLELIGKCLWYMGLAGQLSQSGLVLSITIAGRTWREITANSILAGTADVLQPNHPIAWISLLCSIVSIWWNPMFKQMNKGFVSHISGFGDWYKLQFLSIVARTIFYKTIGTGVFADTFSPATLGANTFMIIFTSLLAILSYRSLKVDLSPLWAATPEKLAHVGPKMTGSPQASQGLGSMADVLNEIAASPSRSSKNSLYSTGAAAPSFDLRVAKRSQRSQPSSFSAQSTALGQQPISSPLIDMSHNESMRYMAAETPSRRLRLDYTSNDTEEMEWTPTETQSQHRAFNSPQSVQRTSESFGRAPMVEQPSPFWYKVPPAPVTPAQRLRNPPNQPSLRVSSQEVKENFFNRVTHRSLGSDTSVQKAHTRKEDTQHTIEFAKQKFFAPNTPSEAGNSLADLLTGFSLEGSEKEDLVKQNEPRKWKRHLVHSFLLLLGILLWHYSCHQPFQNSQNVMLAVMILCAIISLRTVFDSAALTKRNSRFWGMWVFVGGLECAAAVYGLTEVISGRGRDDNCASLGMILIGEMLVHELWVTSMGS